MSSSAVINGFIIFLIASFIFALLKAIPVIIAGQLAGAKTVGYFKAVALFFLIFCVFSIYVAIVGSMLLNHLVFIIANVAISLVVMVFLLKSYHIYKLKNKLLFFILGGLLDIALMAGLLYLIFNGALSVLSVPVQG